MRRLNELPGWLQPVQRVQRVQDAAVGLAVELRVDRNDCNERQREVALQMNADARSPWISVRVDF